MRIAISATQPSLDGDVDPRFGRCQYFIIVDPETMKFEALENPNVGAMGAGIANLKNRAQTLAQELAEIQRRIEELEKKKE